MCCTYGKKGCQNAQKKIFCDRKAFGRHLVFATSPRANGAKRRSGRKPGARVTNFVLGELKAVAGS